LLQPENHFLWSIGAPHGTVAASRRKNYVFIAVCFVELHCRGKITVDTIPQQPAPGKEMIPSGRGQKWQRPSGKTGLWVPGILVLNYLLGYYFFVGSEAM
jgi:hypothetical protein